MKKIFILIMLVVFGFTLSACSVPNSDYYNLSTKTFYYYNDEALDINLYDFIEQYNEGLELTNSQKRNRERLFDVKEQVYYFGKEIFCNFNRWLDEIKQTVWRLKNS